KAAEAAEDRRCWRILVPTHLDLRGPETTDEVLAEKLKGLTKLKELFLEGTQITDAGVQELKKALPDCMISR
ncbi:MAG: hypothetical protein QF752_05050, partial [Planctomycetota bacterium]|nr:hypothetical protein [Planctomycetota bacterium]